MKAVRVLFNAPYTNKDGETTEVGQQYLLDNAVFHVEGGCIVIKKPEVPGGPQRQVAAFPLSRVIIAEIVEVQPPPPPMPDELPAAIDEAPAEA